MTVSALDIWHGYLTMGLLVSAWVGMGSRQWDRRPISTFIWYYLIRPFFWLPLWFFPFVNRVNRRHAEKAPF